MTLIEKQIWNILNLLGVPILDESYNLPYDVSSELNVVNLIRTLSLFEKSEMCVSGVDSLEPEQKLLILSFIETRAVELKEDTLELLRSLPLFEVIEDDTYKFTDISQRKYSYHSITSSTTPQIVLEFHSSNLKILSYRSVEIANTTLKKLGINSLSISSFFTRYVFPVISEMPPRTKILELMRYCKSKFRELCSGEEDFEQSIMNLKWIQCEDVTFRSAHELFDPNVPLFFSFFEKKSSFPPTWMPRDMFDFLKTLGMRTFLSMYTD